MSSLVSAADVATLAAVDLGDSVVAAAFSGAGLEGCSNVTLKSDGRELETRWRLVGDSLVLATARRVGPAERLGETLITFADGTALTAPLADVDSEPADLLRALLELPPDSRRAALHFLAWGAPRHSDAAFDAAMASARTVLRDHLQLSLGKRGERRSAVLNSVVACGGGAFYLRGWIRDEAGKPTSVKAVTPHGGTVDLLGEAAWEDRPVVAAYFGDGHGSAEVRGFCCLVHLPADPTRGEWLIELHDAEGATESVPLEPTHDLEAARESILQSLVGSPTPAVAEMAVAAIERVQTAAARPRGERIHGFGKRPTNAAVSLVVAAGSDPSVVEHHLAAYGSDPELRAVELAFVVTSTAAETLLPDAPGLHEIYGIPFCVIVPPEESAASFAAAANAGIRASGGRVVVLAPGDMIPAASGWLGRLIETHDAHPEAAIVGGTVVRADGTVASAGVSFAREGNSAVALPNDAGSPRRTLFPAPHPVDAVSGYVLASAATLAAVVGLSGSCIDDRAELFAVCLRLTASGKQCWCAPAAEFYDFRAHTTPVGIGEAGERYDALVLGRLVPETSKRALPAKVKPGPAPSKFTLLSKHLREPSETEAVGGHGMTVVGHALAAGRPVDAVVVRYDGVELARTSCDATTPRVADAHPEVEHAGRSGFVLPFSLLGLPEQFEIQIEAEMESGEVLPIGTRRGTRTTLQTDYDPHLRPLFVTTLGRTGSSWLMLLLAQHPELVAYLPFRLEPRVASYWLAVTRALAEPRSYLQAIDPELWAGPWWLGNNRMRRNVAMKGERHIADWLGGRNIEAIASFAQRQIDSFYTEVENSKGKTTARFFVEKRFPDAINDRLAREIYGNAKEIFLVRDLRDVACSSLSFGAKRGAASFGRELVESDEEYFDVLRSYALALRNAWRERQEGSLLLRYEDLIESPESEMARVFTYLGIEAGDVATSEVIAAAKLAEREGQEGHRTAASPAASVGRWRHDLSDDLKRAARDALADLLDEFGYPST
ncbi:MAG TPA: sulfotransferase [Gaiellaceae bacterium]|nr:sulfotransferase [Gaiellaceae bacterium]